MTKIESFFRKSGFQVDFFPTNRIVSPDESEGRIEGKEGRSSGISDGGKGGRLGGVFPT